MAIVDLNGDAASTAAKGIDSTGERVLAIQADLTRRGGGQAVSDETVARFGRFNVLANIAAVRVHGAVTEATSESWKFVINVNLLAVAYGCELPFR